MADITKARKGQLVRALFDILLEQPEGMYASDALQVLAERMKPTDYEAGNFDSGGRRFERIVRFNTIASVKAGWLVKRKGVWTVTDEGRAAAQAYPDASRFFDEAKKLYRKWRKGQPAAIEEQVDDEAVENSSAITLEQAEEMAWKEIEDYLAEMPPYDFQELVGELLKAMGYHIAWVAPPGKDGGVDLLAYNDPLGTKPPRIKVQVKRNANSPKIDVIGLRSFMAVLGEGDVGLFVALSGFTKDAEWEARQSHRRLTLLDTAKLLELWTSHYGKLEDAARRRLPLKPVWFLAGED